MTETLADTSSVNSWLENIFQAGRASLTLNKLFTAVAVALICLIVIKILLKLVDRAFLNVQLDITIKKLIRGTFKALMIFVGVIVVLGYLDIPVTSLIAILSVASLALSLALQNFLSNVAGGLQLLMSQPFKIGDYVEIGDCAGTVAEITLFYTKLTSIEYKLIQIPNNTVVSQNITNYSSEEKRRIEIKISASYEAPVDRVKAILTKLVSDNPLTLSDPEVFIHVYKYGDSAIEYVVRVWCYNKDYWTIYYDLLDNIKPTFDKEEIELTYPHLNIHMIDQ